MTATKRKVKSLWRETEAGVSRYSLYGFIGAKVVKVDRDEWQAVVCDRVIGSYRSERIAKREAVKYVNYCVRRSAVILGFLEEFE